MSRFYIESSIDFQNKVLVRGTNEKIKLENRRASNNQDQLWYTDDQGYIRSDNGMTFGNKKVDQDLRMQPTGDGPRSQWKFEESMLVNGVGECLTVRKNSVCSSGKNSVCSSKKKNKPNRHWKEVRTKGND